ncbi:MAG TPA: PDZ domain-containing protein, partial [Thermoanaerobaculia bacterium]
MRRRSLPISMVIALLTMIVVLGGFASFQRKGSSFERLDFHWVWKDGVIIVDQVDPGSGAEASGLRVGDQIIVVGGTPSSELESLKNTLRRSGPMPLIIWRNGETLATRYTPPPTQVDYRYLFFTLIGFLYLAIGMFTLFRGGRGESFLFYLVSLLTFVVGVYSPAGEQDTSYKALFMMEEFARIFLPPLTLHFFLRFPRPLLTKRRHVAAIYAIPAVVALWSTNLYVFGNEIRIASTEATIRILDRWEMLHFAIYFTLAFVALTYTFRTAP